MHASNLTQIVEEAQTVNDEKLSDLEKKFEVVAVLYLIRMDHDKLIKAMNFCINFLFSFFKILLGMRC